MLKEVALAFGYVSHIAILTALAQSDPCAVKPCHNGGQCIPKSSISYKCRCRDGWMGRYCHRPCRDIYKSCKAWKEEDQCDKFRSRTFFFDINCAVTCEACVYDPDNIKSVIPLPPILEPLDFLIGLWQNSLDSPIRFPTDMYGQAYTETLDIRPAQVPMFGSPALNITSTSRGLTDPTDERIVTGFIHLKAKSDPPEIAFLSSSNEGINVIEYGHLQNNILSLNVTYIQIHPGVDPQLIPKGGSRVLKRLGPHLEYTMAKLNAFGKVQSFTKYFQKLFHYTYY